MARSKLKTKKKREQLMASVHLREFGPDKIDMRLINDGDPTVYRYRPWNFSRTTVEKSKGTKKSAMPVGLGLRKGPQKQLLIDKSERDKYSRMYLPLNKYDFPSHFY